MKTKTIIKFCLEQVVEFCQESRIPPITDKCGCKYYEINCYSPIINDIERAYVHRCDRHSILFRKFKRNATSTTNIFYKVEEPKVLIIGNPEKKCSIYKQWKEDTDDNS